MTVRRRLIATYVVDWLFVIGLAVAVKFLSLQTPRARPFSLTNPNISFPFTEHETVPASALFIIIGTTTVPTIILCSILPALWPTVVRAGRHSHRHRHPSPQRRAALWRRALWELHMYLLGLAATLAVTAFLTEALKLMYGKPRPDCLARCRPDLANAARYVVGGLSDGVSSGRLVDRAVCLGADLEAVGDGFKSFPSGHASSAAAGLGFLSLFLAGKFGVLSLASRWREDSAPTSGAPVRHTEQEDHRSDPEEDEDTKKKGRMIGPSAQRGPPLSLLVVSLIPYGVAIFVASSRWFDFRHHSIDILSGFALGSVIAAFGNRFAQRHFSAVAPSAGAAARASGREMLWGAVQATGDEEEALQKETPPAGQASGSWLGSGSGSGPGAGSGSGSGSGSGPAAGPTQFGA